MVGCSHTTPNDKTPLRTTLVHIVFCRPFAANLDDWTRAEFATDGAYKSVFYFRCFRDAFLCAWKYSVCIIIGDVCVNMYICMYLAVVLDFWHLQWRRTTALASVASCSVLSVYVIQWFFFYLMKCFEFSVKLYISAVWNSFEFRRVVSSGDDGNSRRNRIKVYLNVNLKWHSTYRGLKIFNPDVNSV